MQNAPNLETLFQVAYLPQTFFKRRLTRVRLGPPHAKISKRQVRRSLGEWFGMKLLAFDIGNTNITIGLFDTENLFPCPISRALCPTLLGTWRIRTEVGRTGDEHFGLVRDFLSWQNCQVSEVNAVVMCSVVPPVTTSIVEMSQRFFKTEPLIVTGALDLGIRNAYQPSWISGLQRLLMPLTATALTLGAQSRQG